MSSLAAIGLILALQTAPPQQGRGEIRGTVLREGKAVVGTVVIATPVAGGPAPTTSVNAMTDNSGSFSLNAPAGRYRIRTAGPPSVYFPGVTSLAEAKEVVVEAGKATEGINITVPSNSPPQRSGVVSNGFGTQRAPSEQQRTGEIRGKILRDGKPAAGITVLALPVGLSQNAPRTGGTDATGSFTLSVAPGRYHVQTAGAPVVYFPGVTNLAEAKEVVVEAGKVTEGIDFAVVAGIAPPNGFGRGIPATVVPPPSSQQRTGVITGQFLRGGQPVGNVRIGALAVPPEGARGGLSAVVSSGVTDNSGNYRLERLPAGRYRVRTLEGTPLFYPNAPTDSAAGVVVVEDGKVTSGINFQAPPQRGVISALQPAPNPPTVFSNPPNTAPPSGATLPPVAFPFSPGAVPSIGGVPANGGVQPAPATRPPEPAKPSVKISTYAGIGPPYIDAAAGVQVSAQTIEAPSWVVADRAGGFFVTAAPPPASIPQTVGPRVSTAIFHVLANGNMERVAGSMAGAGSQGDGGVPLLEQLRNPRQLALDAAGNLYIADAGNHRIRMISRGVISTVAGNGKAGFSGDGGKAIGASLNNPNGIAIDAQGNLYIADTGNQRIRRVTPQGVISTLAGAGPKGLNGDGGPATAAWFDSPTGIAVDSENNVFVADTNNHAIRMITAKGVIWTVAGTAISGLAGDNGPALQAQLLSPQAVAVDGNGAVFIADSGNRRIRRVTGGKPWNSFGPQNALKPQIDTLAELPASGRSIESGAKITTLALEPNGNILATSDELFVYRISSKGAVALVAGTTLAPAEQPNGDGGPATAARLFTPIAIAMDRRDNLFIAERLPYIQGLSPRAEIRIRRVTSQGVITTVATGLSSVEALAADNEGNLFVAQKDDIWKIAPGQEPALFAKSSGPANDSRREPGQLGYINGLAVDLDGNVLASDNNHRVHKVDRNGTATVLTGTGVSQPGPNGRPGLPVFNNPQGLAVDGQGNVYIADQSNGRVKKVDRQGSLSTVAGTSLPSSRRVETTDGGPAVQGLLDLPSHVAVDAAGNLYILDGTATGADSSYRIRKVGTDGILSTLVGPTIPLDGKTVRLGASDIAIDSAGNLFVADGLNNRVHKITPER